MTLALGDLPFAENVPVPVQRAFASAESVHTEGEVNRAVDRLAVELTVGLQDANPVILCVMQGGLYFAGMLLQRLVFPLQQGYVHVSRYRGEVTGGELQWLAASHPDLRDRHVLFVDDILDRGVTLQALQNWAVEAGACSVESVVLVKKRVAQVLCPTYWGLESPDRYLFGCGMDYADYGRNLPAIYALKERAAR